jgi:hypothetical protein
MTSNATHLTFVSAQPDWFLVVVIGGDIDPRDAARDLTEDDLIYEPIIAWQLERMEGDYDPSLKRDDKWSMVQAWPITVNGMAEENEDWIIKRPDGEFELLNDCTCRTLESLLEEWNERRARKRK